MVVVDNTTKLVINNYIDLYRLKCNGIIYNQNNANGAYITFNNVDWVYIVWKQSV